MARFHFETDSLSVAQQIIAVFAQDDGPARTDPLDKRRRLNSLYWSLTEPGREFVSSVTGASMKGQPITRSELRTMVTINGQPIGNDDDKFKGVTGGVGVAWNKFFPNDRNPFSGKFDPVRGEQVYQVDAQLCKDLIAPLPPER